MNMQIETYEVEEITGELGNMAADSEAIELASKLGLTGQIKLTDAETGTRNPFRKLTELETLVFSTLFPSKTKVENYDSGPIPLRVLQLLERAKDANLFAWHQIWHPEDVHVDPVLIGLKARPDYATYENMATPYLLARWGTALMPFEQLAQKAKAVWVASIRAKLKASIHEKSAQLAQLDDVTEAAFLTGKAPSWSNYL